jgi:UDP-N-acetylmuramate: L-alanyl-gamma-D-glutamyl-meso-diaminopimelate ligase
VLQDELTEALKLADVVGIGRIHRRERYSVEERLDLEKLLAELDRSAIPALQCDVIDDLIEFLLSQLQENAVIAVLSNGAFDGLVDRLKVNLD